MILVPVTFEDASAFVLEHHRHHLPSRGWKFGVGVKRDGKLVGVAIIGRPVARGYDDGLTLEVTRCCTTGEKNAASKLYGAAWRAAKALGYRRLVTYTLATEPGTSLMAAGFEATHAVKGRSWSCRSRSREDKAPITNKTAWLKEIS